MSHEQNHRAGAGRPFPLGSHLCDEGVAFAVHAPDAETVDLCIVTPGDQSPVETRYRLTERTYGIWHGVVSDAGVGTVYGYRVSGPWNPEAGHRFDPNKILLDPYARRITGALGDAQRLLPYRDDPFGPPSTLDSLGHVPLAVVTAPQDVTDRSRLETDWDRTVIYELHVGSYTGAHPSVPEPLRGTYLGLAGPAVVDHLLSLGITAVELLPVHACLTEPGVRARGMRNHWGYSTGSYFAVEPSYASVPGAEVDEFRTMVDTFHDAGIEVILDVVYNHTCEGGVDGPSLSWRGFDARGYYLLDERGHDIDLTGCGNTLDAASPTVVRMVCDSLRYWVTELGVDGFRFDLASTLGRPGGWRFDTRAPLLTAIAADPVLCRTKLIAEPWDATGPGYQVGGFGGVWSEWNDRYRDTVRRFFTGHGGVRELASRIAGSEDLYAPTGRRPWASVNFVTAHDGFTARDLVSYKHKHNEANGEDNRDGTDNNLSVDHGVEGPTDDPDVLAARDRHVRAILSTLALSTGTPMFLAGDELGHTQHGNNNAYCVPQDTPAAQAHAIGWSTRDDDLTSTLARALKFRRNAPVLRQQEFFAGRDTPSGEPDLMWFDVGGTEIVGDRWNDDSARTLQAWVDGSDVRIPTLRTEGLPAPTFESALLVLHSGGDADIVVPDHRRHGPGEAARYVPVFDSATPDGRPASTEPVASGSSVRVRGPIVLVYVSL
ncbi:glycogen debranching protein [Rhodococcus sp. Leaf7]|uniref:glycogen debranching protein GlgX n=1 Tax=unclassified Rhodococcus (in: high G+C Gram-positive bacteria) TaxID=192944 RepID=UPI0006F6F493|nr:MULTISPECIES: glycogen debranching protein GlgX [unclassified Rhodococcus (in: high G+C Gram-positive bacteria)]KQU02693.1 glycogen debranching protein [Rhodococcus sp. Leaf7]KQU38165.1 glycogen debranching protein [Rhodococcus sp. Leaf247]